MKTNVQQALDVIQHEMQEPICAYIYDLAGMQEQVRAMVRTMPLNTRLFYAIKANPDPRIIEALLPVVKGFEVASIGELLKVRAVSREVPILFGGPGKKESELRLAIEHNVSYIHVESLLELRRIIAIAKEREKERENRKVRGEESVKEQGHLNEQGKVQGIERKQEQERENGEMERNRDKHKYQ